MSNYNDGKWHGWNGGECPVHPESRVEWMRRVKFLNTDAHAGECQAKVANWNEIHAFRVIKEHKEPREFWIHVSGSDGRAYFVTDEKPNGVGYIHVREVLE